MFFFCSLFSNKLTSVRHFYPHPSPISRLLSLPPLSHVWNVSVFCPSPYAPRLDSRRDRRFLFLLGWPLPSFRSVIYSQKHALTQLLTLRPSHALHNGGSKEEQLRAFALWCPWRVGMWGLEGSLLSFILYPTWGYDSKGLTVGSEKSQEYSTDCLPCTIMPKTFGAVLSWPTEALHDEAAEWRFCHYVWHWGWSTIMVTLMP